MQRELQPPGVRFGPVLIAPQRRGAVQHREPSEQLLQPAVYTGPTLPFLQQDFWKFFFPLSQGFSRRDLVSILLYRSVDAFRYEVELGISALCAKREGVCLQARIQVLNRRFEQRRGRKSARCMNFEALFQGVGTTRVPHLLAFRSMIVLIDVEAQTGELSRRSTQLLPVHPLKAWTLSCRIVRSFKARNKLDPSC